MESSAISPRHQEGIQTGAQMTTAEEEGDDVAVNKLMIAWTTLPKDALHGRMFFAATNN